MLSRITNLVVSVVLVLTLGVITAAAFTKTVTIRVDGMKCAKCSASVTKALKATGLDYVCISSGGITADTRPAQAPSMNVQFAERVKREAGIATRAVGLIATPKQAETIVADGKADMVALARAFIRLRWQSANN